MSNQDVEDLARDFQRQLGRPLATVAEAARLLGVSVASVRNLIYAGRLIGSRSVANGPVRITTRRLAEHVIGGETRSKPVPKG